MSQDDQTVANGAGAVVRAKINSGLAALFSNSSGLTSPSVTVPYQFWADTTSNTLKRRNAANTGWILMRTLDESFSLARGSNTILALSDIGKFISASGTYSQTFTAAATLGDGWYIDYINAGTGIITLDPNASETIDGSTTITLGPGDGCRIYCNGTTFNTLGRRAAGAQVALASAATTSLASKSSNQLSITGTTTITSFGNSGNLNNPLYFIQFAGILTLTYNATTLKLPAAASIVTAAGDYALVLDLGSNNWQVVNYYKANGQAITTPANATSASFGLVKPDNTTITISGGVISSVPVVTPGAVGSYAFANYTSVPVSQGSTVSGSSLTAVTLGLIGASSGVQNSGDTLSGTWQAVLSYTGSTSYTGLWQRTL